MKIGDKFKNSSGLKLEIIDLQANGEVVWFRYNNGTVNFRSKKEIEELYTPITEPWKPKFDESYWYIGSDGEIKPEVWNDLYSNEYHCSIGNVFKSKDDPKIEEYKQALLELGKRFNNI